MFYSVSSIYITSLIYCINCYYIIKIKNPREIKGFSLYVKENFNRIKQSQQQYTDNNNMLGSIKHGDIMRILADEYKLFKSIKNI